MANRGRPPHPDILTPREWEVLDLLRQSLTNDQIAQRLGVSPATAKYHVSEIITKLGVATREEAAAWDGEHLRQFRQRVPRWAIVAGMGAAAVVLAAGLIALGLATSDNAEDGQTVLHSPGSSPPVLINPSEHQLTFLIDGELYVVNSDGTGKTPLGPNDQCPRFSRLTWSPDGALLVCAGSDATVLLGSDGSVIEKWAEQAKGEVEWSPTSNAFTAWVNDQLIVRDRDGATVAELGPTDLFPPGISTTGRSRPWSPDGAQLAYWNAAVSELRVYSAESGTETVVAGDYRPMAWLSDGKTLLVAQGYEPTTDLTFTFFDVLLLDLSTGLLTPAPGLEATTDGPIRPNLQLWLSSDTSKTAVLTSRPDGLPGLGVFDFQSGALTPIPDSIIGYPSDFIPQNNVQWSDDGQALFWIDMGGELAIYQAKADGTGLTVLGKNGLGARLSPDARSVAYVDYGQDEDGALYISEVDGSNPRQIDPRPSGAGAGPSYAWRPITDPADSICNPPAPPAKLGPLAIGTGKGSEEICWRDADGESSYEIDGSVRYWSVTSEFCQDVVYISGEIPFSATLPAGTTRFELPDPPDDVPSGVLARIKDLRVNLLAVNGGGRTIASDGFTLTNDPEPCLSPAPGDLKPPDSDTPAAGVCGGPAAADVVTVEFQPDIPSPRCVRALPSQYLRIVNSTGRAVSVSLGSFQAQLGPGQEASSERLGTFLAPGVHTIRSNAYSGGAGEIILVAGTSPTGTGPP